jgi:hypothetical protein
MPGLLDILYPWPVVSILASHLGVGDLLQLSRVNTECRAALHGFPLPAPTLGDNEQPGSVRNDIFVGLHRTSYWTCLKAMAQMRCSEPNHRKGNRADLCRHCSMPVCEACVVRVSVIPLSGRSNFYINESGVFRTPYERLSDSKSPSLHRLLGRWNASRRPKIYPAASDDHLLQFLARGGRLLSLHRH